MNLEEVMALPVHPAAAVFPMLPDDELDELAEDIKANGLQQPIVIKDGVLIDGRNRREACQRAGVVPDIRELNGTDPVAFIISSNINRRHMTKGQRAMAVAILYPEPKRGMHSELRNATGNLDKSRLSQARVIRQWAPELVDGVVNGAEHLDKCYDIAVQRKNAAEGPAGRLETLRKKAPHFADLVIEERMSLSQAESALATKLEEEKTRRMAAWRIFEWLERHSYFFQGEQADYHRQCLLDFPQEYPTKGDPVVMLCQWRDNLDAFLKRLGENNANAAAKS